MTEDDFARLARVLHTLPDAALRHVELIIGTYQDPIFPSARKKPHEVRETLEGIIARANEILDAIRETDVKVALVDNLLAQATDDAPLTRLMEHQESIERLRDWATEAAQEMPRAKPGKDASKVRRLVTALNVVMTVYTNRGLTRAKSMVALTWDVARIADPKITERQITEAIDALKRARNY